ncbi:hypothetical protein LCL97_06960 [Seohaeicola saemankumensis]|nr:hypothetical protein [Seohaeicola saemankumensis]MCA0870555.1 hypothetical protein [Seohaeicola saemankumensis]
MDHPRKDSFVRRVWIWTGAIAAFPVLLYLIGDLGDCVVSSTESYCNRLPDAVASMLFGFYVIGVFGGWLIWLGLVLLGPLVLLLRRLMLRTGPSDRDGD